MIVVVIKHTNVLNRPTTSQPEASPLHPNVADYELYRAEWQGKQYLAAENYIEHEATATANVCMEYRIGCPEGVLNMISSWY